MIRKPVVDAPNGRKRANQPAGTEMAQPAGVLRPTPFPVMFGWGWFAAIALLWAGSLALPALEVKGGTPLYGVDLLAKGWRAVTYGVVAWYANPVFGLAIVAGCLRRRWLAPGLSGLALLLAVSSIVVEPVLGLQLQNVPDITLLAGFYLWIVAIGMLFLSSSRPLIAVFLPLGRK